MAEDKLKLKSSQGEIFEVEPEAGSLKLSHANSCITELVVQVATMSTLIKNMVEDLLHSSSFQLFKGWRRCRRPRFTGRRVTFRAGRGSGKVWEI